MAIDDDVEQYSDESAQRLREVTDELVVALRRFAEETAVMHGGSAEMPSFFTLQDAVTAATAAWQERAFEHTGSSVLPLVHGGSVPDDEDDQDDEDDEDDDRDELDDEMTVVDAVSVVSRWDVGVVDLGALLEAGRGAHRRSRPDEDAEDAAAAVHDPGSALHALLHEHGEPWFSIPGVEVLIGERVFVHPDPLDVADEASPEDDVADDEDDDPVSAVLPPPGRVLLSEGWA